ncbi:MAG: TaqI-like C-terminal specificity domain-containing protein, partial [Bacteroidales bacterium]|nr:TaqI-like C-terminal specificity domain-containing protein [Bacteroidales bacterium]
AAPREAKNFEGEKILIRKITSDRLISTYVPYTSYCNTLLFVLKLKDREAKHSYPSLLGVLNSKFIGWYFRKKFQIANDDTFPQIMIRDILQFSIPNVWNEITINIENLVLQILSLRQKDSQSEIIDFESQIDQLVYQLYGLTEEEIAIVESS